MATTKSITEGKIAGLYELERTLGKGHFAVVKLGRHVFTRQLVAVKIIDKTKLDALAMGHLLQEVRCMKLVQHPNVVRLYEVIDTHTKLYLILELADGGDLYDYILRHEGGVAEHVAKVHFAQIVRAIAYCHRLHVVHRDLKPENVVFFRQQGAVKLTDFGFSNHFQPGTMLVTSCGSLAYSAPEILLGEEYDAPAVDIWSLGVILYMLVCGRPPFQEANDSETLIMIMDCRYSIPPHVSEECRDLISRMLQRDPLRRAPLQDIESHFWLQDVDTSPSPLSSDHSPSAQEHEIILQAMSSGNIAERDTVQEALEANRYNHITATYYLLRERLLQDKQDVNSRSEQHNTQKSDSEPLALVEGGMDVAPVALLAPVSPAVPRRGVCESGDLLASKPSRQDPTFSKLNSSGSCLALSMRSVAPDPPTLLRSLGSLHQICEEEEEEEEAKAIALSAKSSSEAPSIIHISVSEGLCSSNWQEHGDTGRSKGGDLCKSLSQKEELNKEEQERHYKTMLQRADSMSSKLHENITHRKLEKLQEEKAEVLIRTEREELNGFTHTTWREQKNHAQTSGTTQDSAVRGSDEEIQMPPPGTLNKEGNTGEPRVSAENQQIAARSENPEKADTSEGAWKSAEDKNDLQKIIRAPATSKSLAADGASAHTQNKKLPSADANQEFSQTHHLEIFGEPPDKGRDQSGQSRGEGTSDRTSIKDEDQCNELQKNERTAPGRGTIEPASKCKEQEKHTEEPSRNRPHSVAHVKNIQSFTHDAVQCCWGSSDRYLDPLEDNNNAPSRSRLPDPRLVLASCTPPCFSPNIRCVDLGPDAVETRRLMGEATEKTEGCRQSQRGSGDSSADPGKNKNLRERLLQFPLCEKALSFNIQPTSKEKLLPFAQYNCCRVL